MLWQLPPNFERDDVRLAMALGELGPGRHAFEFRHPSWFTEEVEALLRAHDAAFVVADSRRRPLPVPARTASWTYLRFHDGRGRRGNYSERQLDNWAEGLGRERGEGYVFFNNDWESFAVANALRLRHLLVAGGRGPRPRRSRAAPALSARG